MRLTIRVLLGIMTATETAMDDLCNTLRGNTAYSIQIAVVRRSQRAARQELANLLDAMIDSGTD